MAAVGKVTALVASAVALSLLLLGLGCDAFSISRNGKAMQQNNAARVIPRPLYMTNKELTVSIDGGSISPSSRASPFAHKLNSSTKWLVTLAHTLAVWSRPSVYLGPYIVVGSIASVYFTDVLKKIINQSRPIGAPIMDPGMPSSHALVSFFSATAWVGVFAPSAAAAAAAGTYCSLASVGQALVLTFASIVAGLRVVCGYHSLAQIFVGAGLGSFLGYLWHQLGQILFFRNPSLTLRLAWIAYLSGSALFIGKKMTKWTTTDKHV